MNARLNSVCLCCYIICSRCWYSSNAFVVYRHSNNNRRLVVARTIISFDKLDSSFNIKRGIITKLKAATNDNNDDDDENENEKDSKAQQSPPSWENNNNPQDVNIDDFLDTASFLFLKVLDTIEDAYTHLRRLQAEESYIDTKMNQYSSAADCLQQWNDDLDPRPRLLVIGSGWASHA